MSLAFAAVAGVLALGVGVRALGARALVPLTLRLAAPTLVLTGWFYALSMQRYGDWTGTEGLIDAAGGSRRSSFLHALFDSQSFVKPFTYMIVELYGRAPWWMYKGPRPFLVTGLGIGLVIAAIVVAARWSKLRHAVSARRSPSVSAWVSVAILASAPIVLVVQHFADGGAAHPRYLFPMLPVFAAAIAFVATNVGRWLAVALVGCFAVAQLTRIRAAGHLHDAGTALLPPQLRHAVAGQPFQTLSIIVALAGAATMMGCLVWAAAMPAESRRAVSAEEERDADLTGVGGDVSS
jgi:hypothetical protein